MANNEVLKFDSLTQVVEYIRGYNYEFSNVNKATISRNVRTGIPYKNLFKLRYIN